ncbi:MAG TPA: MBL fold metallo-hydrolase [Thermoanaerobaculia bacterium]|jgi:L-ascorbate metabolism protein UlaG (beta-lactamase superfamily)
MARRPAVSILAGAAAIAAVLAAASCARGYRGPVTDHFDGTRFHSIDPVPSGFGRWLHRVFTRRQRPWRDFTDTPPGEKPPARVGQGRMRVTFVNHATLLLQMDGVNVLTDPTWAERADPVLGPRRRRPPGLRFEDLPPIDAVLVSHDHHDHMDLPTLRRLAAAFHPPVLTGLGNAAYLARHGVPGGKDLDWWQSAEIAPGVRVTAVPARHASRRGLFDGNRTLWCGFVVRGPSGAAYFAGDTGYGTHFGKIAAAFPGLRLALLPIGGFVPAWYMAPVHMGPEDAVRACRDLGAVACVPMHFGTFPVSDDAELEPVETLRAALAKDPVARPPFTILDNGESFDVPAAPGRGR